MKRPSLRLIRQAEHKTRDCDRNFESRDHRTPPPEATSVRQKSERSLCALGREIFSLSNGRWCAKLDGERVVSDPHFFLSIDHQDGAQTFPYAPSKRDHMNAWIPVCARPRISAWMSCVPS